MGKISPSKKVINDDDNDNDNSNNDNFRTIIDKDINNLEYNPSECDDNKEKEKV